ncbi:MAG: hypothetical protein ACI4C1_06935 [Lachnospiraceae bacterium]
MITQLSVLVPNKPGQLKDVTEIMAKNNINCYYLSTQDSFDFGIFNVIVDAPEKLYELLKQAGCTVVQKEVLAVAMENRVGFLNKILEDLSAANINLENVYSFWSKKHLNPVLVCRVEDSEEVELCLQGKGYYVFESLEDLLDKA